MVYRRNKSLALEFSGRHSRGTPQRRKNGNGAVEGLRAICGNAEGGKGGGSAEADACTYTSVFSYAIMADSCTLVATCIRQHSDMHMTSVGQHQMRRTR